MKNIEVDINDGEDVEAITVEQLLASEVVITQSGAQLLQYALGCSMMTDEQVAALPDAVHSLLSDVVRLSAKLVKAVKK